MKLSGAVRGTRPNFRVDVANAGTANYAEPFLSFEGVSSHGVLFPQNLFLLLLLLVSPNRRLFEVATGVRCSTAT